jgi:hypothetical protein
MPFLATNEAKTKKQRSWKRELSATPLVRVLRCCIERHSDNKLHNSLCHVCSVPRPCLNAGMQPFLSPTANMQRTLATQAPLWPQHWSFASAVSADSKVTVSHAVTDRLGSGGSGMFVVLGDAAGRLYFFTAAGHLFFEHDTGDAQLMLIIISKVDCAFRW